MAAPPLVYVDTNVFIAAYEASGDLRDQAQQILKAAENAEIRLVASELALAELLVHPLEADNLQLVEAYKQIFFDSAAMLVVPVSRQVLIRSAELRGGPQRMKMADAIHVASADVAICRFVISNDRGLRVSNSMRLMTVHPLVLDEIREAIQ
jgi:predicted nucleic acid-binding protein